MIKICIGSYDLDFHHECHTKFIISNGHCECQIYQKSPINCMINICRYSDSDENWHVKFIIKTYSHHDIPLNFSSMDLR